MGSCAGGPAGSSIFSCPPLRTAARAADEPAGCRSLRPRVGVGRRPDPRRSAGGRRRPDRVRVPGRPARILFGGSAQPVAGDVRGRHSKAGREEAPTAFGSRLSPRPTVPDGTDARHVFACHIHAGDGGRVVAAAYGRPLFRPAALSDPLAWPATGITAEFTAVSTPTLSAIAPGYEDAEAAWNDVVSNPDAMIVSQEFLQMGGGPPENLVDVGEQVEMTDPVSGRTTARTVVGITEGDEARSGAFMSLDSLNNALEGR